MRLSLEPALLDLYAAFRKYDYIFQSYYFFRTIIYNRDYRVC